jgi:molybdopterin/thiamine biosynthesis adenylyltransferase
VSALAEDLRSAFPGLLVIPVPERIAGDGNDRLLQVISVADLVVCTADDPHTMARVNAICYERSLPTIMGCLHERGHTGTIAVSVPPGPCLRCAMRLKDFKELAQARGAGVLSLDFDLVSFAISRLAIDILAFRRWGKWPEESAFPDWCNRVTLQTTHPVRWQSERQEKMRGCVVCDQPTQPKGGAKG